MTKNGEPPVGADDSPKKKGFRKIGTLTDGISWGSASTLLL